MTIQTPVLQQTFQQSFTSFCGKKMDNEQSRKFAKVFEVGDIIIKPKTRKNRCFVPIIMNYANDDEIVTFDMEKGKYSVDTAAWLINRNSTHLSASETDD